MYVFSHHLAQFIFVESYNNDSQREVGDVMTRQRRHLTTSMITFANLSYNPSAILRTTIQHIFGINYTLNASACLLYEIHFSHMYHVICYYFVRSLLPTPSCSLYVNES